MKTPYHPLLGLFCAIALASCADNSHPVNTPVSGSVRPDNSAAGNLFQEVNAYRRSKGVKELQRHSGLDRLAQDHCEYLRQHRGTFSLAGGNISHMGSDGRSAVARERYNMSNVGENVAAANHAGGSPVQSLMSLFKTSAQQNKNLLDKWTHTGVGVVVDSDGTVFATQLFATQNYSQLSSRDRFSRF